MSGNEKLQLNTYERTTLNPQHLVLRVDVGTKL